MDEISKYVAGSKLGKAVTAQPLSLELCWLERQADNNCVYVPVPYTDAIQLPALCDPSQWESSIYSPSFQYQT